MRFHEEVLAQSVRNYAFTRDKKWQKRYETIKPEADNLLRFAATQSKKNRKFFKEMVYANIKCVEYEEGAINLVNKGKQADAINLLEGKDYNLFRKTLQGGLENFVLLKQKKSPKTEFNIINTTLSEMANTEKILSISDEEISKERLRAIGELAARLAHDIKNPLSTIRNIVDILESDNQNPSSQRYFKIMRDNVNRIANQIEDVLTFTKPKPLNIKDCSLNSIINNVINSLPRHENVEIITEITDLKIQCDQEKIETAISNIIINALQAIGNDSGIIKIITIDKENQVSIKIQNTGPNVPEDSLDKIFDPLFTTKQTGTGLGLVSVKNIVAQHGGTISVTNNPVTFTFTLLKHFKLLNDNVDDNVNAISRIVIGQQPTFND
jgi:signal transduction histidine kinase